MTCPGSHDMGGFALVKAPPPSATRRRPRGRHVLGAHVAHDLEQARAVLAVVDQRHGLDAGTGRLSLGEFHQPGTAKGALDHRHGFTELRVTTAAELDHLSLEVLQGT